MHTYTMRAVCISIKEGSPPLPHQGSCTCIVLLQPVPMCGPIVSLSPLYCVWCCVCRARSSQLRLRTMKGRWVRKTRLQSWRRRRRGLPLPSKPNISPSNRQRLGDAFNLHSYVPTQNRHTRVRTYVHTCVQSTKTPRVHAFGSNNVVQSVSPNTIFS